MTDANSSEPSWLQPSPVTLNSDDDDPTAPPKSKEDKKAQLDANSFKPSWATEEEDQGDERKGLLKGNQENYQTDPNNKKKKKKKKKKKREANLNDSDYETSDSDFDVEKGEPRRDPFLPPLRTPLHKFFITLQIVTILSSLSLLASTLTTLYFSVNLLNLTQMTVRMYSIIFTVFIVIGELELFNIFIQNWIARGFIYVYIGVSSEDFLSDGVLDQRYPGKITLFCHITNYIMCGVGALYFILGVFCCRSKREKRRNEYLLRRKKWEVRVARVKNG